MSEQPPLRAGLPRGLPRNGGWHGTETGLSLPFIVSTETFPVRNLLSVDGLRFFFSSFVDNFAGFGVVAVVLVSMAGVGVAEHSGLMGALIRKMVKVAPARWLTFILVFVGVLSSVATDAGYLILVPLAAAAFYSVGRHPLAGLAAAFAGVGAVFGVNLLITPSDSMLTEVTNAVLLQLNMEPLEVTQNYYFSVASAILLAVVATVVTAKITLRRLGAYDHSQYAGEDEEKIDEAAEARGLKFAGWYLLGFVVLIALLTAIPGAPLRDPETGAIIGNTPFMASLVFVISLAFMVCGLGYGKGADTLKGGNEAVTAISKTFGSLGGLLLMFLMIAQFIALFNWSNLPTVAAVSAADLLEQASVPAIVLLIGFILVIVLLDFILPGLVPKWVIFAPVFIPIFATLGVAPQTLLAAYRVADSPVNVLTPLMVYLPFMVTVAQRYKKDAGIGTIIALMVPYTAWILLTWTVLFIAWFLLGIPWAPVPPSTSDPPRKDNPMKTLDFDPIASRTATLRLEVVEAGSDVAADALAVPVAAGQPTPALLGGVDLPALAKAGFTPEVGKAIAFPATQPPVLVAVGVGDPAALTTAGLRDAAAAFARAVPQDAALAVRVPGSTEVPVDAAAAAIVEGILLARYQFSLRSTPSGPVPLESLTLEAPEGALDEVSSGAARGLATARAAMLGRDFASCPAGLLTASRLAELAVRIGAESGLKVEVFDRRALIELGCGGLLGVNKGSVEEPRMIVVTYVPSGESTGHLALVGKGIMYDSGGIALKPADLSHSQMKNDMTGAGDVLAAMSALSELGCTNTVTGYLMCTDNMPSGSAMQLGDVLTMRAGRTVEVINTDAEGRLVMADALVLAVEKGVDAIVDIATLTGACLRTFGEDVAGLMSNDDALAAQVTAAGETVDEPVWRLPLIRSYREQLNSDIADMTNLGGINAGSITAGLFLQEFVGQTPWAHIDIAGTAQSSKARRWINRGPTAFGTRLLLELACTFTPPSR